MHKHYIKQRMTVSAIKILINLCDNMLSLSSFIFLFMYNLFVSQTAIGKKNNAVPIPAKTSLKK